MPNDCHNMLTIHGPAEAISDFVSKARQPNEQGKPCDFNFSTLLPLPPISEDLKGTFEEKMTRNELRVSLWGERGWAYNISRPIIDKTIVTFEFDTAWGPPTTFLGNLVAKYPKLTFLLSCGCISPVRGRWWNEGISIHAECDRDEDWMPSCKDPVTGESDPSKYYVAIFDRLATHFDWAFEKTFGQITTDAKSRIHELGLTAHAAAIYC